MSAQIGHHYPDWFRESILPVHSDEKCVTSQRRKNTGREEQRGRGHLLGCLVPFHFISLLLYLYKTPKCYLQQHSISRVALRHVNTSGHWPWLSWPRSAAHGVIGERLALQSSSWGHLAKGHSSLGVWPWTFYSRGNYRRKKKDVETSW